MRLNWSSLVVEVLFIFGERKKEYHPHNETWWWDYYAVGMLQPIWNRESHTGGGNHEEKKTCKDFEKTPLSRHFVFQYDPKLSLQINNYLQKTKVNVMNWAAQIPLKTCDWSPSSMIQDHQIWKNLRVLPNKNRLQFLRRHVWDLLKSTANDCRLLSSKKNTQLLLWSK